ncbi:MAG: hypothetical protein PUH20_04435 [Eubacterium sp.]|nr:hypothetical protein [Eubacterium sp.]
MQTYLKRIIGGILAIITSFSLFGCSSNQIDEGKMATDMEEILTQLFMSVQCGDKNTFRNFFADHVVELPTFTGGCNYIFDIFQGDLMSVNFYSAGHTEKQIVPGEQICFAYMTFIVTTSQKEYQACVEFYTKYESKYPNDPYKIKQISLFPKLSDGSFIPKESDGNFSKDWIAFCQDGIYYPGWRGENAE